MPFSADQIERVARLARLAVSEEERASLAEQLNRMIGLIDAVFLRLGAYEGRNGPVTAPQLLARALRKDPQPAVAGAAAPFSTVTWMLVVSGASIAAVAVLSWRLWRKTARGIAPYVPHRG